MNKEETDSSAVNTATKSSPKKLLSGFIKLTLAGVIIYFAGRQLVNNWAEVSQYDWTVNPWLIFLSVVLHIVTFGILSKMWCLLINAFGYNVSHKYGFKISYISNLGRYIPGKVWPVFGMIYLLDKIKISKETAFASWGVATVFGLPPAFLAGFITFSLYPEMLKGTFGENIDATLIIIVAVIFLASLILIFVPDKSMIIFNRLLRLLRRPEVKFKLEKKVALKVYVGYFIGWTCYGLAFYTFIHSIIADPAIPIAAGIGAFVMAYVIGYLAFFSPGGLGARELVLITILTPFIGPISAGVAVAARVWNLVCEIVAALIALSIKMEGKRI